MASGVRSMLCLSRRLLGGQVCAKHSLRLLSSQPETGLGPVYELRIYKIKPEKFAFVSNLVTEKFNTRYKHSKALGFWITELGGIFETVHIWPYASVGQRAAIRKGLVADTEWTGGFLKEFLPCANIMENSLTVLPPGTSLATDFEPSPTAAYELLSVSGGQEVPTPASDQELLVGRFKTLFGQLNTEHLLFRYADVDTAFKQARSRQEKNKITGYSRFMLPHAVSALK